MQKSVLKKNYKIDKVGHVSHSFSHKQKQMEQLALDFNNTTKVVNSVNGEDILLKEKGQIESAEQTITKQKSKNKKIWNALFFVLNIVIVAVILVYQITQETITPISDIKNIRFYFLPIIIALFFIVMWLDAYRTNLFLVRSGSRSRPYLCYKMCAVGKYYDNITPMSTGGEPSQILYMNHRGLSASMAISVPMARYVVSQISWMVVGLFAVIMIASAGVMDVSVVLVIGLLGFSANFLLTSVCLLLSLSKKLGNKLVIKTLKLLKKMRIIKHYEKQYEKVNNVVDNYQSTMKTYAKNKLFFLYTIFISLLIFVLNYTMPYLIYLLLGGTNYGVWMEMLVFSVIIELGSSIIPIPGGTGMSEISFTVVFGTLFPEGTVFWGLLIWRFVTYYMYLIQGIFVIIYDYAIGNRKFRWLQRKWELEAESIMFKEEQIKNYKKNKKKSNKKL